MSSLFSEVSVQFKHQQIYALLDVLMGTSRDHGLTSRVLEPENSFISIMEDAVLDSALTMDSRAVVTPPQDERSNVPKKHVVDSSPKFCPPRKGVSAIRSFPPGCGRGASRVSIQNHSIRLQNDGLRAKSKQCHGATSKNVDQSSAASFPARMKMTGNKDRSTGVKDSRDSDYVKSGKGRPATGSEPMVRRIVVQGMMASPNCPWRLGKRMRNSKLTKRPPSQGNGV